MMEEKGDKRMSDLWLNNKREYKKLYPDDSGEIYFYAVSFLETAEMLKQRLQTGKFSVPYIVNITFAAELFLKTIIVAQGDEPSGHNLYDLYNKITDQQIKARICAACPVMKGSGGVDIAFEDMLKNVSESFEYWRYIYEKNAPVFSISFFERLVEALKEEAESVKIEKANV